MSGAARGPDGRLRCPWALTAPDYLAYHDQEWGRAVTGDDQIFERLTLEAFQAGLSWLTILRKRENFRTAFAGFKIARVAAFDAEDRDRLLADPGIVRNRAKVDAAINNARVLARLDRGLGEIVWRFAQTDPSAPVHDVQELPSKTPASAALAKALKGHGLVFVGPTTVYALMEAVGLVNDHLADCWVRNEM